MASLPADRTKLALAQSNQNPLNTLGSSQNKNALTEAYDTIDLLNQKVDLNYGTGAIGTNQLATDSVTLAKMADSSVGTTELVAASVTLAKMAAASVGTSQLVDGSVTDTKIASGTITADKFVAGALNNDTQNGLLITAISADILQREVNVKYPPSGYVAAVGDGVTDDTAAIQAIINSGYKNIYIPSGTYKITAPLKIKDSQNLYGAGVSSILKGFGIYNAIIQSVNNGVNSTVITQLSIKGLYLLMDASATINYGIDMLEIAYSVVDTVEVNGFVQTGIYLNNASASYNSLYNIIAKNCQDGIRLESNANSTRIISPVCTNNTRNGIRVDGATTLQSCEIIGGSVEGSTNSGIFFAARGSTIVGVHVEGNAEVSTGYGIEVASVAYSDNFIAGCYFFGNGNNGTHDMHVSTIPTGVIPNAIYSAGNIAQKYIANASMVIPDGYGYYGPDTNGMFTSAGDVVIQTKGSGQKVQMKGKGGFDTAIQLNSKVIYNADGTIVYSGTGKSKLFGTVAPTTGTYTAGDTCVNTAPTLLKSIDRWKCIVGGSPGTWRAVGIGQGTTANRPTLVANDAGYQYLDTTIAANGSLITWTGTIWVNAAGTSV